MKKASLWLSLIFFLLCFMIILIALGESNIAEDDQKYVEERIKRERLNITIYFLKSEFYYLLIISKIKKKTKLTKQGARRS